MPVLSSYTFAARAFDPTPISFNRRQHQISVSVVGPLSWPLIRPGYTPDKFDALLHRSDYDLEMGHRLELTLAARGLRL